MPSFERQARQAENQRGGRGRSTAARQARSQGPVGAASSPGTLLGLQRSIGNAATTAYLQRASGIEEEEMIQGSFIQREDEEKELEEEEG